MDPTVVFGMTASAITVIIVQVAKAIGLPVAMAPWFTLACAAAAVALGLLLALFPQAQVYVEAVISVLFVFLISTGLYHGAKNVGVGLGLTTGTKSQ